MRTFLHLMLMISAPLLLGAVKSTNGLLTNGLKLEKENNTFHKDLACCSTQCCQQKNEQKGRKGRVNRSSGWDAPSYEQCTGCSNYYQAGNECCKKCYSCDQWYKATEYHQCADDDDGGYSLAQYIAESNLENSHKLEAHNEIDCEQLTEDDYFGVTCEHCRTFEGCTHLNSLYGVEVQECEWKNEFCVEKKKINKPNDAISSLSGRSKGRKKKKYGGSSSRGNG